MVHEHASIDCLDVLEHTMTFFLQKASEASERRPPRDSHDTQTARLRPWLYTTLSTIDSRELSRSSPSK